MLPEVRGFGITGFQAGQALFIPVAFMTYADLINPLQPQPFLPHRYPDPQGALVILEAISSDPGAFQGKLNVIQDDHDIGTAGFVEKRRERGEKGLTG
jgi:hypothetical protein